MSRIKHDIETIDTGGPLPQVSRRVAGQRPQTWIP
eukprot:CAMPEP_0195102572 /NCGR_PEP_ID=MMETSP0448-20130528/68425_1 /TAXON_ID=66468 /ORGANISM="Heterocapsa triquestra, Strain CCMP 448" /LENGTH=34 /DNA_ID= /DNA_START= /DNA_END= /DNA_ORIENTATION=